MPLFANTIETLILDAYRLVRLFTAALTGDYHFTCHSFSVLSADAVARVVPSGEKATASTKSECPVIVLNSEPSLYFHSFTALSADVRSHEGCKRGQDGNLVPNSVQPGFGTRLPHKAHTIYLTSVNFQAWPLKLPQSAIRVWLLLELMSRHLLGPVNVLVMV